MLAAGSSPDQLADAFTSWIAADGARLEPFREVAESMEDSIERGRGLLALLWDEGWSRWGWPEEVGGLGGDVRHRAVVYEALAEAGVGVPEPCQVLEVAGPAVLRFAPHLAHEHLADFIAGRELWTLGFSEPDAGSDLTSVRSQLTRTPDGGLRLNGQKTWNGMGHLADRSIVLCRSPDADRTQRDLTMAFVGLRSPGATVRPIVALTGRAEFAEVFYDDVALTDRDLVGGAGGGWAVIRFLMQYERGTYAWPRQARLHRLLDALVARGGFDTASDARRLGDLYLDLAALRLKTRESLHQLADPEGDGPGADASIDKLLLVRAEQELIALARDATYPAVEVGDGEEAARWRHDFLYARALSIFGGTNEIQRNIVAERVLGLPREHGG